LRDFEANLLPVGLLRPLILLELQAEVEDSSRGAFEFVKQRHVNHNGAILEEVKAVHFADWVISEGKMTEVMGQLAEKLRSGGKHLPALRGTSSTHTRRLSCSELMNQDGGMSSI
jgi:hypothetical protein